MRSINVRPFVGFFIILHWLCVIFSLMPLSPLEKNGAGVLPLILKTSSIYLQVTKQAQSWTLFCPSIPTANEFISSSIYYSDGTKLEVVLPRQSELGFVGWSRHRWLKFQEALRRDVRNDLRTSYAKYLIRKIDHQGKSPIRVVIYMHSQELPAIGGKADNSNISRTIVLLSYGVKTKDLP